MRTGTFTRPNVIDPVQSARGAITATTDKRGKMARAPLEQPEGLLYRPEVLTVAEERCLLEILGGLRFDPIVMHGVEARRRARHYGLGYDYGARQPRPGEELPDWLRALRDRVAEAHPGEYVEALVQRYPEGSTIGWHRD